MDAIKGSELNVPDAVFAWVFDGQGGVKPLVDSDTIDKEHPCWLHLNYTHVDSAEWLASTPLLPNNVRDALAGESTRPRVTRYSAICARATVRLTAAAGWWRSAMR